MTMRHHIHMQEHRLLGLATSGGNTIAVSSSAELAAAFETLGDRRTLRQEDTSTITLTNGSATVTSSGTDWQLTNSTENAAYRAKDLIRFRNESRYYKIEQLVSDTEITLAEPYLGVSASAVSMTVGFYYLDRATIMLMPFQNYYLDAVNTYPGIDIAGSTRYGCVLSEGSATYQPFPIGNWGDNRASFIEFAPSNYWSSLDLLFGATWNAGDGSSSPSVNNLYKWAGMESVVENCTIDGRNLGGSHGGGFAGLLPLVVQGRSVIRNCTIKTDNATAFNDGYNNGDISPSIADTFVLMQDNIIEISQTRETTVFTIGVAHLRFETAATFDIVGLTLIVEPDLQNTLFIGSSFGGLLCTGTACELHLANIVARYTHDHATIPTVGIEVLNASTVNIDHSNFEALGTVGEAIRCNHASATINVRNTRLKGSVSAVNCLAGTVNLDTSTTDGRIGTTIGAGTTNVNTAT